MKKYLLSCLLCFFTLVPFYGQRVLFPTPSSYTQDKGNCNIGRLANVSGTGNEAIQLAESLKAELQHQQQKEELSNSFWMKRMDYPKRPTS